MFRRTVPERENIAPNIVLVMLRRGLSVRFLVTSSKVSIVGSSSESEESESLLSRASATLLVRTCLRQASVRARLGFFRGMTTLERRALAISALYV